MYVRIIPNIKNTGIKCKFWAWLFNHVPALKRDSQLSSEETEVACLPWDHFPKPLLFSGLFRKHMMYFILINFKPVTWLFASVTKSYGKNKEKL